MFILLTVVDISGRMSDTRSEEQKRAAELVSSAESIEECTSCFKELCNQNIPLMVDALELSVDIDDITKETHESLLPSLWTPEAQVSRVKT